jgi:Invasion associated locus B (IalB) protein
MSARGLLAVAIASVLTGNAAGAAEGVAKIETFSAWTLFADAKVMHEFCFVTSEPTTVEPKGASRDSPRLYISAWPKDGIKAEVSFRMGFAVKKASEPAIHVGDILFRLFGSDDRLYVRDATQELKLVDAMKKGSDLKAEVASERGTAITDTYSLAGLGQAMAKLQDVCF